MIDRHLQRIRVVDGRGKGDVRYIQLSAQVVSREKYVAYLGQAESDGIVRSHSRPHHLTRVAVDPGGNVDAEHCLSALVDQTNDIAI